MDSWKQPDCGVLEELRLPVRFRNGILASLKIIDSLHISGLCCVILYGSCAEGNIKTSSDIDLLIVTQEKFSDRAARSHVREKIDQELEQLNVSADIVFYSKETLLTDNSVFTKNIREHGITLWRSN